MTKSILITGAASFLGRNLVKNLNNDYDIFVTLRKGSNNNYLLDEYNVHILDEKKPFPSVDSVIHLAWGGVGSIGRSDKDIQVENVRQSKEILQRAVNAGIKKFIFLGSQAEIGEKSEYGKAKAEFGRYGLEFAKAHKELNFIHLRMYSLYGFGDHETSLISSLIEASLMESKNFSLGACSQNWNYLYIEDAVEALRKINEVTIPTGVYDFASADTRSLRDYVYEANNLLGSKKLGLSFGVKENNCEGDKDLNPNCEKLISIIGNIQKTTFAQGFLRTYKEYSKKNEMYIL